MLIVGLAGFAVARLFPEREVVLGAQEEVRGINWEKIVQEYPTYRDGYVQLVIEYLTAGNKVKAGEMMQKVLEIDPNYELSPTLLGLLK